MQFKVIFLVNFLYLSLFLLKKTNGHLTKHELDELYGKIKELYKKLESCNIKLNSLILSHIQNKTNFDITEYLTSSPYLDN